jgi:hypothetical protein
LLGIPRLDGRKAWAANKGVTPFRGMGASVACSMCFNDMIGVMVGHVGRRSHQGHETYYGARVTRRLAKPSPGWRDDVDKGSDGDTGGFAGGLIRLGPMGCICLWSRVSRRSRL